VAIKHVKDFQFDRGFGFTGSAGKPAAKACGGRMGYADGGPVAADTPAITDFARGGPVLPKKMRPSAARGTSPIGKGARKMVAPKAMPKPNVNHPPMVPEATRTPPDINAGGVTPYGVQPAAEPAGGFLRRGGAVKKR
jgi:hypothetical protein